MRHLKKFNESIEEGLDIEYIKFCFIDMVEADKEVGKIFDVAIVSTPMLLRCLFISLIISVSRIV